MQRPKDFDSRLMAYLPALRKLSVRLANPGEREDLVQDTLAYLLTNWTNFRNTDDETGQPTYKGFYTWVTLNMRSIAQAKRKSAATKAKHFIDRAADGITKPQQEDIVYAGQVCRRLSRTREGRMLVRVGGGETLKEIGSKRGIGVERVRQLTERARTRLVKSTKVAA